MTFTCLPFYQLSLDQLYAILMLRQAIFIVEQDCPYLDADDKDQESWHLMGFDDDGHLGAYTRLVPMGISYPKHPSIGRVLISKKNRGKGIGRVLMKESLSHCRKVFGAKPVKISAQAHLQDFYTSLGFEAIGETYLEDGIPHIGMIQGKLSQS